MQLSIAKHFTKTFRALYFSEYVASFKLLRDMNILIYWPHGFGDWVFASYIFPFLEPTNRYWITRFGDDSVNLMEGNLLVRPLYTGVQSPHCGDGSAFSNRHFGVALEDADGSERDFCLPLALYESCVKFKIDAVIQSPFDEALGNSPFPFHTKARNMISRIGSPERVMSYDLTKPLKSSLSFDVDSGIERWVEAQLRSKIGIGDNKLCLIGRNGYTTIGKNWGHRWRNEMPLGKRFEGEECREFMRLMLKRDPKWVFIVMEDILFEGYDTVRSTELNAFSYCELFGSVGNGGLPYATVMKILVNIADLAVGVPAGPYHLCMARPDLPTVGIWIEHLPSWYDEPKGASIHVISHNIKEQDLTNRPGSFEQNGELKFQTIWSECRIIPAELVMSAVEKLLD